MRRVLVVLILLGNISCSDSSTSSSETTTNKQEDYAYKLTVLSNPSLSDTEQVGKRYRFLIPRMVGFCEDVPHADKAADMVYFIFKKLMDIGLVNQEDLLPHTEALHRIITETALLEERQTVKECTQLFVMYLNARKNGNSLDDSVDLVATGYSSGMRLE